MRKMQLAMLTLGVTVLAGFVNVPPAAAHDYPWCAQGGGYDYPGDCTYSNLDQCQASVSGRLMACGPNPLVAYGQVQQPQPHPRRKIRRPVPY